MAVPPIAPHMLAAITGDLDAVNPADAEKARQLIALRIRAPMRSVEQQQDAGHLPLFVHANEPTRATARATARASGRERRSCDQDRARDRRPFQRDDGTAALIEDQMPAWRRARREGREIVEFDPKRLQSRFDGSSKGDVRASYSAQSLCEDGRITAPFRFRGHEWVQTGGLYSDQGNEFECFRVVALDAFDGASETYSERNDNRWEAARNNPLGGYHGMKARHGSREIVLVGPPIVIVAGQPEQAALL